MRWFNTVGPVKPTDHYLIAPLSRIELGRSARLGALGSGRVDLLIVWTAVALNRSGLLRTQTPRTTDEPRVEQVPEGVAEHV